MLRKLSTCGQMGVTSIHGTAGWTTDPPAAILYAVEPVGLRGLKSEWGNNKVRTNGLVPAAFLRLAKTTHVANMMPSACTVVK
jgi:hypothetical protein